MITFKDIGDTKIAMKDAWDYKEKICSIEASYNYMDKINTTTATQMNTLLGRFYNQPKKAVVHTWIRKNKYNANGQKMELQMSKSGIGATYAGGRIDVYTGLITKDTYYESKGLLKDVIEDKKVYDKVFNFSSEKGKSVLKVLKEAAEETKIQHPESTTIKYSLKLSEDERECFGLKERGILDNKDDAYIEIKDSYKEMTIEVKSEYARSINNYSTEGLIFKVNSLDINDEKDFQYFMFVHYHLNEFENALRQYQDSTEEHKGRWTKFKEIMNEKLAKWLILYKM